MPDPVALGGEVADILRRRAAAHAMVGDHLETGFGLSRDHFRIVGHKAHRSAAEFVKHCDRGAG